MLNEYALDPNAIKNWERFRYYIDNFGVHTGRLIAKYPNNWKKFVYEACRACGDIELARIEERLRNIDDKLCSGDRKYEYKRSWIENAVEVDKKIPFFAIISDAIKAGEHRIIDAESLDETTPYWNVSREERIEKKAEKMSRCAAKLLNMSREILFVDRYFDPREYRYRRPLWMFLKQINTDVVARIEYHLESTSSLDFQKFWIESEKHIRSIVPKGMSIRFVRWTHDVERLHARYVLTEKGGLRFDSGLDEGKGGATVDVCLVAPNVYKARWKDYHKDTTKLKFVDELVIKN